MHSMNFHYQPTALSTIEDQCTAQSIVKALDDFVGAVNHMQEVVMVPSRLKDIDTTVTDVHGAANGPSAPGHDEYFMHEIGHRPFRRQSTISSSINFNNSSPSSNISSSIQTADFYNHGNGRLNSNPSIQVFILNDTFSTSPQQQEYGQNSRRRSSVVVAADRRRSLFSSSRSQSSRSFDFGSSQSSSSLLNTSTDGNEHRNPVHVPNDLFACYKLLDNVRKELVDGSAAAGDVPAEDSEDTTGAAVSLPYHHDYYQSPFSLFNYDSSYGGETTDSSSAPPSTAGSEEMNSSSAASFHLPPPHESASNSANSSDRSERIICGTSDSKIKLNEDEIGESSARRNRGTSSETTADDLGDPEAEKLGLTFRHHLTGLFNVVRQLTEHAKTVSDQYVNHFEKPNE